jgi:hypothetical protein
MTRDASFKKAVRRHAGETGQRYTEALTDLKGLGARMHHEPAPERLLAHLRDRYGIDPVAATKLSVHKTYVFRIDRKDGSPWVARAFPLPGHVPVQRGTPQSSGSWSGRTIPQSAWRSTMRYLISMAVPSSSRGSFKAPSYLTVPRSSP